MHLLHVDITAQIEACYEARPALGRHNEVVDGLVDFTQGRVELPQRTHGVIPIIHHVFVVQPHLTVDAVFFEELHKLPLVLAHEGVRQRLKCAQLIEDVEQVDLLEKHFRSHFEISVSLGCLQRSFSATLETPTAKEPVYKAQIPLARHRPVGTSQTFSPPDTIHYLLLRVCKLGVYLVHGERVLILTARSLGVHLLNHGLLEAERLILVNEEARDPNNEGAKPAHIRQISSKALSRRRILQVDWMLHKLPG